jgi:hypothetical protein
MYRQLIGKRDDSQESPAKLVHSAPKPITSFSCNSARMGERTTRMHISLLTYGNVHERASCRRRSKDKGLYLGCSRSARPLPHGFTGHVTRPTRFIVSLLLPQCSPATSRLYRPCRSSHSLHRGMRRVETSVFSRRSFALSVSLGGCLARSR